MEVRALIAGLAADPDILAAAVDAARANAPAVAALPRQETVRHTLAVIAAAISAFADGRGLAAADLAAAARLGADRAEQDVPIAALLDGFQAGRATVIRLLVERLRADGVPADDLLDAFVELDGLIAALEHQLAHAHHKTEVERLRTARDQRDSLLRALLTGSPFDPAALPGFGLDPGGRYHCLVSAEHDARAAHRLETRLGARSPGLYGLHGGYLAGITTRPPSTGVAALLVIGPAGPLAELPGIYRMCCAARDAGVQDGVSGPVRLADLAVPAAFAASPEFGRMLAADLLGPLNPATAFHRDLVETALTHLNHGGHLEATAGALHVHVNTVKYRLRRLRDLTGFPTTPTPVLTTTQWTWALKTWQPSNPPPPGIAHGT